MRVSNSIRASVIKTNAFKWHSLVLIPKSEIVRDSIGLTSNASLLAMWHYGCIDWCKHITKFHIGNITFYSAPIVLNYYQSLSVRPCGFHILLERKRLFFPLRWGIIFLKINYLSPSMYIMGRQQIYISEAASDMERIVTWWLTFRPTRWCLKLVWWSEKLSLFLNHREVSHILQDWEPAGEATWLRRVSPNFLQLRYSIRHNMALLWCPHQVSFGPTPHDFENPSFMVM